MWYYRETDEIGTQGQRDSGRRIGERITDTTFWRNEASFVLYNLLLDMKTEEGYSLPT